MAKSPEELRDTMIANLPEKTGKPLEDWVTLLKASGLEKHGEMMKLLKGEHGVSHGFANLIVHMARGGIEQGPADPVAEQYAGAKAGLKPIYDAVIAFVSALGDDLEISPKKTYVSLRRSKQFALVQPSTKTRVDLGINLKGRDPEGRLEASGSFNGMVSHRVRLAEVSDFDADVQAWLKDAYDAA
jgi:hypothetical protein